MTNQQVTTHQYAWLAGIWDGEGSFCIVYDTNERYVPRISLSNTDIVMINEIIKILDSSGINGHLWEETTSRKPNHKKAFHITVNKMTDVKTITELMLPYLISKKPRAELLLRFINSRLSYKAKANRDPKTGQILGIIKQGYSEEEKTLYEQMKDLNRVGIIVGTSETLCQTL